MPYNERRRLIFQLSGMYLENMLFHQDGATLNHNLRYRQPCWGTDTPFFLWQKCIQNVYAYDLYSVEIVLTVGNVIVILLGENSIVIAEKIVVKYQS